MKCFTPKKSVVFAGTFSSLIISAASFAGDQKGSGGGGVVCRDGQGAVQSVTTLDIYEAAFRGIELDYGPEANDPLVIVDTILDRLKRIDPKASDYYRGEAHKFFDPGVSRFVSGISLPFTEDTGPVAPPVGCKIEQIVFQMEPTVPEDRLYTINKDLFSKLDAKNQAVLILHEVIYHELGTLMYYDPNSKTRQRVHPNSYYVRYYNERLFGKSFLTITPDEYVLRFSNHPTLVDIYGGRVAYMNCRVHRVSWRDSAIDLCRSDAAVLNQVPRLTLVVPRTDKEGYFSIGNAVFPTSDIREDLDHWANLKIKYKSTGEIDQIEFDPNHSWYDDHYYGVSLSWGQAGTTRSNGIVQLVYSSDEKLVTKIEFSPTSHVVHDWNGQVFDFRKSDSLGDNKNRVVSFEDNGQITALPSTPNVIFGNDKIEFIVGTFDLFKVYETPTDDLYASFVNPRAVWEIKGVVSYYQDGGYYMDSSLEMSTLNVDRLLNPTSGVAKDFKLRLYGDNVVASFNGAVTFSKNLHVSSAILAAPATLATADHHEYNFKAGTTLFLNDDGLVTTWKLP